MEEQKETSTSYTSTGGESGGRGDSGDVEEDADDNQRQLSPATIVVDDDDLQRKLEKARLNQDLVFSIQLVSNKQTLCTTTFDVDANFDLESQCIEVLFIHFHCRSCISR